MALENYEYQSDFAKKYLAMGRAEGEAEGRAASMLRVLEARGVNLSDEQRQRVLDCRDLALLDQWIDRAVLAESADDVFA